MFGLGIFLFMSLAHGSPTQESLLQKAEKELQTSSSPKSPSQENPRATVEAKYSHSEDLLPKKWIFSLALSNFNKNKTYEHTTLEKAIDLSQVDFKNQYHIVFSYNFKNKSIESQRGWGWGLTTQSSYARGTIKLSNGKFYDDIQFQDLSFHTGPHLNYEYYKNFFQIYSLFGQRVESINSGSEALKEFNKNSQSSLGLSWQYFLLPSWATLVDLSKTSDEDTWVLRLGFSVTNI